MPEPSSKERLEILKMIQEGKITPEEGIRLIEALEHDDAQKAASRSGDPKWLVVEVSTKYLGKDKKPHIARIPFSVISVLMKFIPRNPLASGDLDLAKGLESLKKGETFSLTSEKEDRWFRIYTEY